MASYFSALNTTFSKNANFSFEQIAESWAEILEKKQDYLRYVSILSSIIEKNVTVERLAEFKKKYFDSAFPFCKKLSEILNISEQSAQKIFLDVLFYASASASSCEKNPLVQKALKKINIQPTQKDFFETLKDFILMELNWNKK